VQTWPAGQKIGGKPVRELQDAELGIAFTTIANNAVGDILTLPWWVGGFSKCYMQIFFQVAVTGPVQMRAAPLYSDGTLLSTSQWELLQGGAVGPTFAAGATAYVALNFDDGVLPGNYVRSSGGVTDPAVSLALNPCWNKAPFIRFQFLNGSGGLLTFEFNNRIYLAGS
jgi:hypothetical protein